MECREVPFKDQNGETHRADVITPLGITIEFQHSPISDKERYSRELFYKELVWVIDGQSFKNSFHILHSLPDPLSDIAKDKVWLPIKKGSQSNGLYYEPSKNIDTNDYVNPLFKLESIDMILTEVELAYNGHHIYDWVKPRQTWLNATCPVYIDFGEFYLAKITSYNNSKLPCVQLITKKQFLLDIMHHKSISQL